MSLFVLSTISVSWVISLMMLDLSWTISVPTLGLLVTARADSNISPMCGMYDLRMNNSFGSFFVRNLWMELVIYDGLMVMNKVMSSEEAFRVTADSMSVFFARFFVAHASEVIDSVSVSISVLVLVL